MGTQWVIPAIVAALVSAPAAHAVAPSEGSTPVTVNNFVRAESDTYLASLQKRGGLGNLHSERAPASIDKQDVIRLNRDTLYTSGVFDLDAGPVTIALPDAGKRFMSMQVISEDHYVPAVVYGAGSYTFDKDKVGTRYVAVAIRTLVDPNDPKDVQAVHTLQDAIKVSQASHGTFEVPHWDPVSQKKIRDALLVLAVSTTGFRNAFGKKGEVDPVAHLMGMASFHPRRWRDHVFAKGDDPKEINRPGSAKRLPGRHSKLAKRLRAT